MRKRLVQMLMPFQMWEDLDAHTITVEVGESTVLVTYKFEAGNELDRTFALKLAHGWIAGAAWGLLPYSRATITNA